LNVTVVGGGLAGCEAALTLAGYGAAVTLFDIKPQALTPAHGNPQLCELVCSNSLKSNDPASAAGLLKAELRRLHSFVLAAADKTAVQSGGALAVDRAAFAAAVTAAVHGNPRITVVCGEVTDVAALPRPCIVATGPLTTDALSKSLTAFLGEGMLSFYDAASPIVTAESIDPSYAFAGSRYGKGGKDYLNCPLEKPAYLTFYDALVAAETVPPKTFEPVSVFEGCMPIEVQAKRGRDAIRFGPLKPVGLTDENGKKFYAVVQLRAENADCTAYNLVGFQTNLTFPAQKRVFSMIPALHDAEFVRLGVMHRNTFVCAPRVLGDGFSCKADPDVYVAGQLSGVEGYVESIMSGRIAAESLWRRAQGKARFWQPPTTMLGALCSAVTCADPAHFQPVNANFGLLPPLLSPAKQKTERYAQYAARAALDFITDHDAI
jgi:methylenetetrahydrofolate--tRNA-(uracil-5-)-methyltransferase